MEGMTSRDSTARCPFTELGLSSEYRVRASMRPGVCFLTHLVSRAPNSAAVLLVCRKGKTGRPVRTSPNLATLRGNAIQVGAPQLMHRTGQGAIMTAV